MTYLTENTDTSAAGAVVIILVIIYAAWRTMRRRYRRGAPRELRSRRKIKVKTEL